MMRVLRTAANKRRHTGVVLALAALQQLPLTFVRSFSTHHNVVSVNINNMHSNNALLRHVDAIHAHNIGQPFGRMMLNQSRGYSRSRRLQAGFFDGDNNNGNGKKKGFLSKVFNKVKDTVSPKTEEQKRAEIVRKEVSGGLSELLKDAPLPVRMLGKMVAPMLSGLAETMGEQARQVEDLVNDARFLLINDMRVMDLLGEPIDVGMPFQQSSSSVNINGEQKTSVQASFQVQGPRGGGVANLSASGGGSASIEQLTLNAGGRVINVDVSGRGGGPGIGGSPREKFNKDDIIDVEFVDKTYNR